MVSVHSSKTLTKAGGIHTHAYTCAYPQHIHSCGGMHTHTYTHAYIFTYTHQTYCILHTHYTHTHTHVHTYTHSCTCMHTDTSNVKYWLMSSEMLLKTIGWMKIYWVQASLNPYIELITWHPSFLRLCRFWNFFLGIGFCVRTFIWCSGVLFFKGKPGVCF